MKMRTTILATVIGSFALIGATETEAQTIPERMIEDLQEDFGFEDFQAAGVVGNFARETGNFRYMQELNPVVKGSRGGIGYAQWTGPRRRDYEAWADGRDLMAYEVNYGFLVEELNGRYSRTVTRVLATSTVEEAAEVFMNNFLIPHPRYQHLDERISYATAYMDRDFSGAGCQDTHEIQVSGRMMVIAMCPEKPEINNHAFSAEFALADIDDLLISSTDEVEIIAASAMPAHTYLRSDLTYSHTNEEVVVENPFANFMRATDLSLEIDADEVTDTPDSTTPRDDIYSMLDVSS